MTVMMMIQNKKKKQSSCQQFLLLFKCYLDWRNLHRMVWRTNSLSYLWIQFADCSKKKIKFLKQKNIEDYLSEAMLYTNSLFVESHLIYCSDENTFCIWAPPHSKWQFSIKRTPRKSGHFFKVSRVSALERVDRIHDSSSLWNTIRARASRG